MTIKPLTYKIGDKTVTYNQVWNYMINNYDYHVDPSCDVLNTTGLAEDTANYFEWYEDEEYTPADELFEMAHDVAKKLLAQGLIAE